ncbi:MAG TPA: SDR family oxidoreductase [Polyangiaceae bacterium]|jgi:NAD(P)-dependent dehydrogenase (short-subunit alcohol dehydrogenase family)
MKATRALVTGAGGVGCGRAIARRFARDGAVVVCADLDELGAHETARLIAKDGGRAIVRGCDVRVAADVEETVAFAARELGGLDVLVNDASAPYRPSAPLDNWVDTVATDLIGAMTATRAAIEIMKSRGGAIVNMGSTSALGHGRTKAGGSPAYDVAKAGVMRLTTMLAWLGEKENIRVNCLLPDWVATPEIEEYVESVPAEERAALGIPAKLTTLEQIAEAVRVLATDETLAGRVMVWWSEDEEPRMIPFGDRGYAGLEEV